MSSSEVHPTHDRLAKLIEVGRAVVSELDVEVVLRRVLDAARELTGAQYAALGVLGDDRKEIERFLTAGLDPETVRAIGDLPRGRGVLGVLIDDPRPLRLSSVGDHARSYGFPAGHPPMTSFLGVPILIRGEAFGNLYLTNKQDGDFDETDEETIGVLADWAAVAIVNARAYQREQSWRRELQQTVAALEATTAISRSVAGETDPERVLELVVKRSRALVEARVGAVLLVEEGDLLIAGFVGDAGHDPTGTLVSVRETLFESILAARRPQFIQDVAGKLGPELEDLARGDHGLFAPLVYRGRTLGVLVAFDLPDHRTDALDEVLQVFESFATSAAIAFGTAKDVASEVHRGSIAASERERARWARELHDDTLQELAGLKLALAAAQRSAQGGALRTMLQEAIDRTAQGITNLRHLITDLRPAALDDLGVAPALRSLVARMAAEGELEIDTDVDLAFDSGREPTRLAIELESTIYRVIQEALNNVTKHAGAKRVAVSVAEADGSVKISVRDDGAGFDRESSEGGFGLIGIRERVALVQFNERR